jgi:hypothetical protein
MCFTREWLIGLKLRCVAPRLSHNKWGDSLTGNASSLKRVDNHIVSEAALASARYSASVVDLATVCCFLELQEMGLDPKKLIYAEVDVRSSTFPAESAPRNGVRSQKIDVCRG